MSAGQGRGQDGEGAVEGGGGGRVPSRRSREDGDASGGDGTHRRRRRVAAGQQEERRASPQTCAPSRRARHRRAARRPLRGAIAAEPAASRSSPSSPCTRGTAGGRRRQRRTLPSSSSPASSARRRGARRGQRGGSLPQQLANEEAAGRPRARCGDGQRAHLGGAGQRVVVRPRRPPAFQRQRARGWGGAARGRRPSPPPPPAAEGADGRLGTGRRDGRAPPMRCASARSAAASRPRRHADGGRELGILPERRQIGAAAVALGERRLREQGRRHRYDEDVPRRGARTPADLAHRRHRRRAFAGNAARRGTPARRDPHASAPPLGGHNGSRPADARACSLHRQRAVRRGRWVRPSRAAAAQRVRRYPQLAPRREVDVGASMVRYSRYFARGVNHDLELCGMTATR